MIQQTPIIESSPFSSVANYLSKYTLGMHPQIISELLWTTQCQHNYNLAISDTMLVVPSGEYSKYVYDLQRKWFLKCERFCYTESHLKFIFTNNAFLLQERSLVAELVGKMDFGVPSGSVPCPYNRWSLSLLSVIDNEFSWIILRNKSQKSLNQL